HVPGSKADHRYPARSGHHLARRRRPGGTGSENSEHRRLVHAEGSVTTVNLQRYFASSDRIPVLKCPQLPVEARITQELSHLSYPAAETDTATEDIHADPRIEAQLQQRVTRAQEVHV